MIRSTRPWPSKSVEYLGHNGNLRDQRHHKEGSHSGYASHHQAIPNPPTGRSEADPEAHRNRRKVSEIHEARSWMARMAACRLLWHWTLDFACSAVTRLEVEMHGAVIVEPIRRPAGSVDATLGLDDPVSVNAPYTPKRPCRVPDKADTPVSNVATSPG